MRPRNHLVVLRAAPPRPVAVFDDLDGGNERASDRVTL